MIQLPHIKARIERLHELEKGLVAEAALWKGADSPLKPLERQWYTGFVWQAVAALRGVRESLAAATNRLEREGR